MISNYETNFYIRKDSESVLWSGISVNAHNQDFYSYKLSCFIKKDKNGNWKSDQTELIILDKQNNMYTILGYDLSQLYAKVKKGKSVSLNAEFSKFSQEYSDGELISLTLDSQLLKDIINELTMKTQECFAVKIKI